MSMFPCRLAAHAAIAVVAAGAATSAVRADPPASRADAVVGQAFGELPEEASTAYGDLCREKKPGGRAGAPTDFMPDCNSLLTKRLNEAAKAPKRAASPVEPIADAKAPEPAEAERPLSRVPNLPPPVPAAALAPETISPIGSDDIEIVRLETAAPAEVTAVDVEKPASAEAPRKTKPAARSANRQAEPARRAAQPKPKQARSDQEPPRSGEARPAPAAAKEPPAAPGAAPSAATPAAAPPPQPAAEPKKGQSLSEFAAKLFEPFTKPAQPAQPAPPPAAPAAQPQERRSP